MGKPARIRPRLLFTRKGLKASAPTNPLREWARGETELYDIEGVQSTDVNLETVFIRIEAVHRLQKAHKIPHQSLEDGRDAALAFVHDCLDALGLGSVPAAALTAKQVAALGKQGLQKQVPPLCHPLYFFGIFRDERPIGALPGGVPVADAEPDVWAAYIGKKLSETHRFKKGHVALGKLHDDEYDGLRKYLFLARPFFLAREKRLEVPVEWLSDRAEELVGDIEHQMIFESPKTFNEEHKDANVEEPRNIVITNLIPGYRQFLHGWLSMHPKETPEA